MRHADKTRIASGGGLRQRLSAAGKNIFIAGAMGVVLGAAIMGAPLAAQADAYSSALGSESSGAPAPRSSEIFVENVSNGTEETTSFVYGDTIRIQGRVAEGLKPERFKVALNYGYYDRISDPVSPNEDGTFLIEYDTTDQKVPIGDNILLMVELLGSDGGWRGDTYVTISLSKKSLNDEYDVTVGIDSSVQDQLEIDCGVFTKHPDESFRVEWLSDGQPAEGEIVGWQPRWYTPVPEDLGATMTAKVSFDSDWYTFSKTSDPFVFEGFEYEWHEQAALQIDYQNETVAARNGEPTGQSFTYELTRDPQDGEASSELSIVPGETIYVRFPGFYTYKPSEWRSVTLPGRPDGPSEDDYSLEPPVDCTDAEGMVRALSGAPLEYRFGEQDAWHEFPDDGLVLTVGEKLQLRFSAGYGSFASEITTVEFDAPDHTPGADWESDADGHWHVCVKGCNVKLDKAEHDFEWAVEKDATETEPGKRTGVCTVCGYKTVEMIPATGEPGGDQGNPSEPSTDDGKQEVGDKDTSDKGKDGETGVSALPQTGDPSALVAAIATLGAPVLGVGCVWSRRRK